MKFFPSKKVPVSSGLNRQEALQCTPVVNASVSFWQLDSGEIVIEYPLPIKPFFLSLFRRFQESQEFPTKKLQLDAMGSHVWKEIDGSRTVGRIISRFAASYSITIQEAEKSVTTFLFELGRRGIIAMR